MPRSKKTNVPPRPLTEQDYIERLEKIRWKGKPPVSPYDSTAKVWKLKDGWYMDSKIRKKFNVRTGTIFQASNLPLWKWFEAFKMYSRKQNVSAHQLAEDINVDIKTALFTLQRLREASDIALFSQLNETSENFTKPKRVYEVDETYIGGKNKNRHWDKKIPNSQGRSGKDKIAVLVIVERSGNAIAEVVPNVKQETLEPIIRTNIEEGSTVNTDEWLAYKDLGKWYKHLVVNHRKKQYVKGEVSVNTAESFNAHLKNNYWTYRHISRKYAPLYIKEFVFRYNTRNYRDKERCDLLLTSSLSK